MADVRRRKVLPGIARKPQGYTSMQMLAYARSAREAIDANHVVRVDPIIQETPMVIIQEKNTNNTIWMKMRPKMVSLICKLIALTMYCIALHYRSCCTLALCWYFWLS